MSIHLLSADVAGKIAAGEVVERPANVAKELIENSLDAGAREINVEIGEGGQRMLRVIDDGHGIPADDLPLALHRHATSKLRTAADLNRIATGAARGGKSGPAQPIQLSSSYSAAAPRPPLR